MTDWHKSSYSGNQGACVEVSEGEGERVLVRDTQNRDLGHLDFAPEAWSALLSTLTDR